jgi:flavin reductase (DIM6/NTAB) family NADH-FMN oxidoreductase RutF
MRELAGTVTVVTAGKGIDRRGLTATAVCSLSAEPPSLIACVHRLTGAHDAISRYRSFCVNVIGPEHVSLADRFAGRDGTTGIDRFAAGRWTVLETGAPVLEDAVAAFDCDLLDGMERETHSVFVGGVRAVRVAPRHSPLLYCTGRYQILFPADDGNVPPQTATVVPMISSTRPQ